MPPKKIHQIFLWPMLIGLFTGIGLVVALIYDQGLETISLGLLSIPIIVILYFYYVAHYPRP
jgi:hypothetical protein